MLFGIFSSQYRISQANILECYNLYVWKIVAFSNMSYILTESTIRRKKADYKYIRLQHTDTL